MRLTRRQFLAGGIAAAGLAACGGDEPRQGRQQGASGRVTFWHSFTSNEARTYFKQQFVDEFNKTHPDIQVVLSVKPIADLNRLLQTALAARRAPDIVVADGPAQAVAYVDAGRLRPLDEYAGRFGWEDTFLPWALEAGKVGGKLYSLPTTYETMVMLYNPGTFAANGWQPPGNRREFEAICADAQGKGLLPVAIGNADWKPATEWFVTIIWNQYAGPAALHEALRGERPWTDPLFVEAIDLLAGYFRRGWMGGGPEAYFTNQSAQLYRKLARGEAAMILGGSWQFFEAQPYFGAEAGNDARWDWAPLPVFRDGVPADGYALSVGSTYSMNAQAKAPDAVATYLDWQFSDPRRGTNALARVGQNLAPVRIRESDFPSDIDQRYQRLYVSLNQARNVGYTTWTFWPPKSDTYIFEQMDRVITGKLSAADYAAGLQDVFAEELAAGKVPPLVAPSAP
jgi:raffinose/stachyose/melibiose transport system substrate-binding protein